MTYRKLMEKVDAGEAEVRAWEYDERKCASCDGIDRDCSSCVIFREAMALVTFFKGLGAGETKAVKVTSIPIE